MRRTGLALLALGIVALGGLSWRAWTTRVPVATAPARIERAADARLASASINESVDEARVPSSAPASNAMRAVPPSPPNSLRDTTPDGRVTLGPDGRVRPDLELRRLFDYFLSAIGEWQPAEIRAALLEYLRRDQTDAVAQQVLDLFDRYVRYQSALADAQLAATDDLGQRLQRAHALRVAQLGADLADAFFADEEAYGALTVERLSVLGDTTLDAQQRAARLADIEARLAPDQRESQQMATAASLLDEQTRQFQALGADQQQRHDERAALWGEPAAARLAALDVQRADWDVRVAGYISARDALAQRTDLDANARMAQVAALRAQTFDVNERQRVEALEAIDQLRPGD